MNRREALGQLAVGVLGACGAPRLLAGAEEPPAPAETRLGIIQYAAGFTRALRKMRSPDDELFAPAAFLEFCRELGAGGMQVELGVLDDAAARSLRAAAEKQGMFIDAIVAAPRSPDDVARFEAEMRSAAAVGALAARTVIIPGRRYEQFHSLEEFRAAEAQAARTLELAAPVADRIRVPLAIENHKDQRLDERLALLERFSSEYVGCCVDTGNNVALLDDPLETVARLAPWAHTVHLKDQLLQTTEEGFLLGDIPFGQGVLDLAAFAAALQKARPNVHFVLEILTRDALRVPCLTDEYWTTLPDVPGRDLARTLRLAQAGQAAVQSVGGLSLAEQAALERSNLDQSLRYARERLRL